MARNTNNSAAGMDDSPPVYGNLPFEFEGFGLLPGVAQSAQNTPYVSQSLFPQPYFSQEQLDHAMWYTTRVHLSPTGKV